MRTMQGEAGRPPPASRIGRLRPDEVFALSALAAILAASAGWWALALWPAGDVPPAWLARTRYVCFGIRESGLPSAAGWVGLVGSPLGMLATLVAGWPDATAGGLAKLARARAGRVVLTTASCLLLTGSLAAARQVTGMLGRDFASASIDGSAAGPHRLYRPAPPLELTDQHGQPFTLEVLRGRPVIITFGFGHCGTVCPLLVHDALAARDAVAADPDRVAPAVVVVTLDPWRDTPTRTPHIAERWGLGTGDYLLTGEVETVEATLNTWEVARSRDPLTGDITHPALTYILDADGAIVAATAGGRDAVLTALRQLAPASAGD
ncbi:MAG TPA: SCO family protein [Longimicrobiales bacterium]|nr:SCO family protein [Longimicrobiales bacterium]